MSKLETITKEVYGITKNLTLKHQVNFGNADSDGNRRGPIFEKVYGSKNYNSSTDLKRITLVTSDYLILYYSDKDTYESLYFSYPHLYNLERILRTALKWFYTDKYRDLYIYKDDEIIFNSKYNDTYILTDIVISQKTLLLKPTVVYKNEIYQEGIMMVLNDDISVTLDVDELESFYYTIKKFDLYNSSITLANYGLEHLEDDETVDKNGFNSNLHRKLK